MKSLKDKLIEISFFPHSDLFIEWPSFIKEISVSTGSAKGRIAVKYSGVPYFAYFLTDTIMKNIDEGFIESLKSEIPDVIEYAKKKNFISFAEMSVEDFYEITYYHLEFKSKLWNLLNDERFKERVFNEELKNLKEILPDATYTGFVPGSAEYSHVDILCNASQKNIYLAQRKNILKLNLELSKELLKKTIKHYGINIAPCLKKFINS